MKPTLAALLLAITALSGMTPVNASLNRIKSAMNVAGYCATSEHDVHWHASHGTKEKCEAHQGEWISREHHHGSRRLGRFGLAD